ncbi:hypothetical protein DFH08DRAFT_839506 [Mycena albidolilacea]|uniref:Secreted protein n=1 Tax=Mycena albidolilacea TaxID=1033008 RepID=A0AAD7AQF2_9AGAR|nr:hypothetical protein DFH08DRAFT_839506 [Mycena albidolilacea]
MHPRPSNVGLLSITMCFVAVGAGEDLPRQRGIHTSTQHPVTSNMSIFKAPKECIRWATASPVYFPLHHRYPSRIQLITQS